MLAASLAVLLVPGVALAGDWFYDWSCAGECSPGRLVIEGREGPFATREECDWSRDRDLRADEFVRQGNLGGLTSCYEVQRPGPAGGGGVVVVGTAPAQRTRIAAMEVGVSVGPGWLATGEDGISTSGTATWAVEIDQHAGRDSGGGSMQIGLQGTWLEAPMLGPDPHHFLTLPMFVGIVATPRLFGGKDWSVRADLGASLGLFFLIDCSDCVGPVFDETLAFGYTMKAGVDVYTSKNAGFSLDLVFPRWEVGSAGPGNLRLESPAWLVRLSILGKPD